MTAEHWGAGTIMSSAAVLRSLPEAFRASELPVGADCDVTILLATYNGAAFLQPQLASLLDQSDVTWRLRWRDDGSSDRSAAIVREFTERSAAPGQCVQVTEPAGRIGVGPSYAVLAREAPGAIAFCDQDDVWLPHKLARGRAALDAVPAGVPALYCARQTLVDAALRPIGTSPRLRRAPDFMMALTQNIATGCTMMLNGAAADLLRAAPPPTGALHDWWCFLLVTGAAGQVVVDDEPVVLYRQHGGNLIGAPHTVRRRAIAALRRGPSAFMAVFRAHVTALMQYPPLLDPDCYATLVRVDAALRSGVAQRATVLLRHRLRRQTPLETALFATWFLIG